MVEGDSQVFKVFFPDRVQQRLLSRRSLTFPVEVFKVYALDRIQQRMWSKSLTFQIVAVFKVFSQARVLPHRVDCLTAQMREFMFSHFSPGEKARRYSASRV